MTFEFILEVLLVLACAILLGEAFEQFRLPSVAGELLSGLVLGPALLGLVSPGAQLQGVASVSLFFIIFMIGFELNTKTLAKYVSKGLVLTMTSFAIPLALSLAVGILVFPFGLAAALVVALGVSVPSISIISVILIQYNMLEDESGLMILASVTVTDTVAFIVLEAVSAPVVTTLRVIAETGLFVLAFVVVDLVLNRRPALFRQAIARAGRVAKREEVSFAALILVGLTVASLFEVIGLSYIVGAFFAGLIVHDRLIGRRPFKEVSETFSKMNGAFFIPFFFGFAGVEADLQAAGVAEFLGLALVLGVSLVAGIGFTYVAARSLKHKEDGTPRRTAVVLGGRGAVGIVIASVALTSGVIDETAYSLVILGTLVASLIAPLLLGRK